MDKRIKITVFTPTYNRAYIIENLYRSLQRQTFEDFEWLVIDDGSSDSTEELFAQWREDQNVFPIRYYKQKNGGKCRAINHALDLAKGELFFTVDSDDYITDDALEKVDMWFSQIDPHSKIKGVVANRGYTSTQTENYLFREKYLDCSLLDIYTLRRENKQVFDGERAFIFYTDFHKKYLYPEFDGENFMTEAVAWNRMANDGYLMRYVNDIIWVFEYKEDGLTKCGSEIFLKNPKGYGLWLREKTKFLHEGFLKKLKMYYTFVCDLQDRFSIGYIADCIGAPEILLWLFCQIHRLKSRR